jgi:hypothetical protein
VASRANQREPGSRESPRPSESRGGSCAWCARPGRRNWMCGSRMRRRPPRSGLASCAWRAMAARILRTSSSSD